MTSPPPPNESERSIVPRPWESLPTGNPSDAPTLGPGEDVLESTRAAALPGGSSGLAETRPADAPNDPPTPEEAMGTAEYLLERIIGRGGMGEVWEATQLSLGRRVALKRIRATAAGTAPAPQAESFRQEAIIAGLLEHPNIVPVHDLGTDPSGALQLSMKLVVGTSWDRTLRVDYVAIEQDDFLAKHLPIFKDMCQAVAFAHRRGVVHRDLKPSQVMVGDFGEVMLMDWGLALRVDEHGDVYGAGTLSQDLLRTPLPTPATASNPAGTPAVMAPEQTLSDARSIGPWTDVYLLGGTLYWLLTGTFPHEAGTTAHAMALAALGAVESPFERAPERNHPPALVQLCLAALQRDPKQRPKDGAAFLAMLDEYLSGTEKRARARALLRTAEELANDPRAGSAEFSRAAPLIEDSLRMWGENPAAARQRTAVTERHSERALAQGDLALAKLQAESLTQGARRVELLTAVADAEARVRRRERTTRLAAASIAALLLLIAGGSAYFTAQLRATNRTLALRTEEAIAQRQAAERNLSIAEVQGKGAFDVILFVFDKLKGALAKELTSDRVASEEAADEIRHAIAGEVASPAYDYLLNLETDAWPKELRLEHADRQRQIADRFRAFGRLGEARSLGEVALGTAELLLPPREPALRHYYHGLALTGMAQSDLPKGREWLERSIEMSSAAEGAESDGVLRQRMLLATVQVQSGQLAEAAENLRSILAIQEKQENADLATLAGVTNNLAAVYERQREYSDAERQYRRAAELLEQSEGSNSIGFAIAVGNVGNMLGLQDKHAEAEPFLRRSLAIREKVQGKEHPNVATALNNLAVVFVRLGNLAEAEATYRRVIEMRRKIFGEKHAMVARAMSNLAYTISESGRREEAIALYREALAMTLELVGENHPMAIDALESFGEVQSLGGAYEEGAGMALRAFRAANAVYGEGSADARHQFVNLLLANRSWVRALASAGDAERSNAVAADTVALLDAFPGRFTGIDVFRAEALFHIGRRDEAREVLAPIVAGGGFPPKQYPAYVREAWDELRHALEIALPEVTPEATSERE